MSISRLLLLCSLVSAYVSPLAAQTTPFKNSVSAQSQLEGLVAPPEFRPGSSSLPPSTRTKIRGIQPDWSFDATPAQNDADCYSIRSYRVTRDNPNSDSTRLAGYTECQPAKRFQVKSAVQPVETPRR